MTDSVASDDTETEAQRAYNTRYNMSIGDLSLHYSLQMHAGAGDLWKLAEGKEPDPIRRARIIRTALSIIVDATGQVGEPILDMQTAFEAASAQTDPAIRTELVQAACDEMESRVIYPHIKVPLGLGLTNLLWVREAERAQWEEEKIAFPDDWAHLTGA